MQAAHDIRSPLSALNIVAHELSEISDEKREVMSNAIQRINDIANDLLSKAGVSAPAPDFNWMSLDRVVQNLVNEKALEFRDFPRLEISAQLENINETLSTDKAGELSRVLSNLINNAVEASDDKFNQIRIVLRNELHANLLIIEDRGKGIEPSILERLGREPISIGKENGFGLGVFHAFQSIAGIGGSLSIESKVDHGTTVYLLLPKSSPEIDSLRDVNLVNLRDPESTAD